MNQGLVRLRRDMLCSSSALRSLDTKHFRSMPMNKARTDLPHKSHVHHWRILSAIVHSNRIQFPKASHVFVVVPNVPVVNHLSYSHHQIACSPQSPHAYVQSAGPSHCSRRSLTSQDCLCGNEICFSRENPVNSRPCRNLLIVSVEQLCSKEQTHLALSTLGSRHTLIVL